MALEARFVSGEWGGVESVVAGLASGLSTLDGDEFIFLTLAGHDDWLRPYVHGSARRQEVVPSGARRRRFRRRLREAAPWLAAAAGHMPRALGNPVPASDGWVERLGVDVVHLTVQSGFRTSIPTMYHPHDLQHVHLPEFFRPNQRLWRERAYRTLCEQATMVAVASTWTKHDVEGHFGLSPQKVVVVPLAPPLAAVRPPAADEATRIAARLRLPERYLLYPAQTWPHKNHLRLVEALRLLGDRGLRVDLVLTGMRNDHARQVEARASALGVDEQIRWLGFVTPAELDVVYRRARAVVIPSLFEAASAPLWEAFQVGVPAACSNVTSLPDQAGDAALVFDPHDPVAIADAIGRIWTDEALRAALVDRGRRRVGEYSWPRTARIFRAHYRRIAGRTLSDEDHHLLSLEPTI